MNSSSATSLSFPPSRSSRRRYQPCGPEVPLQKLPRRNGGFVLRGVHGAPRVWRLYCTSDSISRCARFLPFSPLYSLRAQRIVIRVFWILSNQVSGDLFLSHPVPCADESFVMAGIRIPHVHQHRQCSGSFSLEPDICIFLISHEPVVQANPIGLHSSAI